MKTSFVNKLKQAMNKANITQSELSKISKIRQSSISDWLNGKYTPKQDKIDILARALNVSPAFLLGWEEETDPEPKPTTKMLLYENFCANCSSPDIPEYSDMEVEEIEMPNAILGKVANKHNLIMIKSRGDSMNKIIPEDSLVIVEKIQPYYDSVQDGDIVLYSFEGCWSIKELIRQSDKVIFRPHSNNPKHQDNIYNFDDINAGMEAPIIIGKVVYYGVIL